MRVRINPKTAVLLFWLTMASIDGRFAPAQSSSGSPRGSFKATGAQSPPASPGGSSDIGKGATSGARASANAFTMSSQWTAGGSSFGPAGASSWQPRLTSETDSGMMWNAGMESFGDGPQTGGIWRVRTPLTGTEEPAQESTPRGINQFGSGNALGAMTQSPTGNQLSGGPSAGLPANGSAVPQMTISRPENAPQGLNQFARGNPSSFGRSVALPGNSWTAPANTPAMKPASLHGAGSIGMQMPGRRTRTSGSRPFAQSRSFARSSVAPLSRNSGGENGHSSRAFGTSRRTSRRSSGSKSSRRGSLGSPSGRGIDRPGFSSQADRTQQTQTGLGGRLGGHSQRSEHGNLNNLGRSGVGNQRHPPWGQ
jgi:hypothetical protein